MRRSTVALFRRLASGDGFQQQQQRVVPLGGSAAVVQMRRVASGSTSESAQSAKVGNAVPTGAAAPTLTLRRHRRLYTLAQRETREEKLRDFLPESPQVPHGWTLHHVPGTARFDLHRTVYMPRHEEKDSFGKTMSEEEMHCIVLMERKMYEGTYRMDNGEREEPEYFNFTLFIRKPQGGQGVVKKNQENLPTKPEGEGEVKEMADPSEKATSTSEEEEENEDAVVMEREPKEYGGGLEVGVTAIDMELVLDSIAIHGTRAAFENAKKAWDFSAPKLAKETQGMTNLQHRRERDRHYRGPMLSELDEELTDEFLEYLDERGINNGFAEYVMRQAYYYEQEEYLRWLELLKRFAQ